MFNRSLIVIYFCHYCHCHPPMLLWPRISRFLSIADRIYFNCNSLWRMHCIYLSMIYILVGSRRIARVYLSSSIACACDLVDQYTANTINNVIYSFRLPFHFDFTYTHTANTPNRKSYVFMWFLFLRLFSRDFFAIEYHFAIVLAYHVISLLSLLLLLFLWLLSTYSCSLTHLLTLIKSISFLFFFLL